MGWYQSMGVNERKKEYGVQKHASKKVSLLALWSQSTAAVVSPKKKKQELGKKIWKL
jgi:hypothetical protein